MKKAQKERVEDDGGASGGRVTEPPGFSIPWLSKHVQKQNRITLKVIFSNELKLYSLRRSICIGRDVLEKYEDVVGRTRERRRVCLYNM